MALSSWFEWRVALLGIALVLAPAACGAPKTSSRSSGSPPVANAPTAQSSAGASPVASQAQTVVYNGLSVAQLRSIMAHAGDRFSEIDKGVFMDNSDLATAGNGPRTTDAFMMALLNATKLTTWDCPSDDDTAICTSLSITRLYTGIKPDADALKRWNDVVKTPAALLHPDDGELEMQLIVPATGLTEQKLFDSITWFEHTLDQPQTEAFWQPYKVNATQADAAPATGTAAPTATPPPAKSDTSTDDDPIGQGGFITPPSDQPPQSVPNDTTSDPQQ